MYISVASRHPGGAQVAFLEEDPRYLSDHTDPRTLEAMTTISGGEDVSTVFKQY